MKIVLASSSPRRKEILSMVLKDFEIRPSQADENCDTTVPVCKIPKILSEKKALCTELKDGEIIIASDTLVICDGETMGKPKTRENAIKMLEKLSGKVHSVISGICVRSQDKIYSESVETKIFMRKITPSEIERYVDSDKPFDKAGAYGIQESAGAFIQKIDGDFYNVVGLPLCRLVEILKDEFEISLT